MHPGHGRGGAGEAIDVLLFAGIRERVGAARIRVDGLAENASVADLRNVLIERYEFLRSMPFRIACDREIVADEASLLRGEVALIPPVSGG